MKDIKIQLDHMEQNIQKWTPRERANSLATLTDLMDEFTNQEPSRELTEAMRLADLLHEKQCGHNHTDGCDWFYGEWFDGRPNHGRSVYIAKAQKLLGVCGFDVAMKAAGVM